LEPSYEIAEARACAIGGTSFEHLSSFITWLSSQQYSAGYACIVARHALAFCRWCEAHGIEVPALTDLEIERFQRSRARRRSRRPETRRQERQALKLLLLCLQEKGICNAAASCFTDVDRICAEFAQHLRCNHALAVATFDIELAQDHKRFVGTPCTFLERGKCSIHPWRPMMCRTLVNMDSVDLLCRLVDGVEVPVPYISTVMLKGYFAYLTRDEQFADIRDWFPPSA